MPSTSRISGLAVLLHLGACFYLMVLADNLVGRWGAWCAGFAFFGYMGIANGFYARDFFRGRAAARRGQFDRGAELLQAAVHRFEQTPVIDRFRFVLLLSPTATRFREAAMLSLAHCHVLAGRRDALDVFALCVDAFPKSSTANASLALLRIGARFGARGERIDIPAERRA